MRARTRGNALVETIVALAALSPVIGGIVLLGKQLDVKHKTYDALRYSVWERTVWSSDKPAADITVEALDRALGNPTAGVSAIETLRTDGISQNPLWAVNQRSVLDDSSNSVFAGDHRDEAAPVRVGYEFVPALTHSQGTLATASQALELNALELSDRAFASSTINVRLRPVLGDRAPHRSAAEASAPITMTATGAVLSDAWSAGNENEFRRRVDNLTVDEVIERLESQARPLAMQSRTKGGPLYGEGQYSFNPDLRPRSNALPTAYVDNRQER